MFHRVLNTLLHVKKAYIQFFHNFFKIFYNMEWHSLLILDIVFNTTSSLVYFSWAYLEPQINHFRLSFFGETVNN